MRVWDTELLTAKKAPSPVMDGLLFWLDGRDELTGISEYSQHYDPPLWITSYMTDRVSGKRVDWKRGTGGSNGLQSISPWLFAAGHQMAYVDGIDNVKTVEIVMGINPINMYAADKRCTYSANRLFFPKAQSGAAAKVEATDVITDKYVDIVYQGNAATGIPEIWQNGIDLSVHAGDPISAFTVTNIIDFLPANKYLGSVRLYSRSLSQAEIMQNLNYEISIGRITT